MKILIADDDPVMLDTLRLCVATEGFDTLVAADGEEAFALWDRHRPDLLDVGDGVALKVLDGGEEGRGEGHVEPSVGRPAPVELGVLDRVLQQPLFGRGRGVVVRGAAPPSLAGA